MGRRVAGRHLAQALVSQLRSGETLSADAPIDADGLAVDPAYQRRGLGQWLLIQLLVDARQRGLHRATLEVRCSNQVAILLYQGLGFQVLGQRQRYYADGEDALILWHQSLQSPAFHTLLGQRAARARDRLGQQGWQLREPERPIPDRQGRPQTDQR